MGTLFHPRVLKAALASAPVPPDLDARQALLLPWIERLRSGELVSTPEVQLHAPFLQGVFGAALGYRTWNQPSPGFDLHQEVRIGASKRADGAIGWFGAGEPRLHAPVELKGARQSLDAAGSRALTPVEQAWGYANRSPGCRWIIVSNYRETRLYSTARSMEDYESVRLDELDQPLAFRRFWLLLGRPNLLPEAPGGRAPLDEWLTRSAEVQEEVTHQLYRDYRGLREDLFHTLGRTHPNHPPLTVLGLTQKLLDRVLFVAFAEDRGLLPAETLKRALEHKDLYHPTPIWENLKVVFRWVDRGHPPQRVPPYNGGLFTDDPELDALELSDDTCRSLQALTRYDFAEDVSVEVLGHIFEQSITDLEELRGEATGTARALSRRKAEGVFYTPSFLTRYIVERTLGRAFEERFGALVAELHPDAERGERRRSQAWLTVWSRYAEWLRSLRVLDPACGSGAFLVAAFERLYREYERVNASLEQLRGNQLGLFDLNKTILNENLFGMDLNPESVEITKLSLWLKTAERDKKLTWLDGNIRCGNSVVSDPRVHPRAVDWGGDQPHLLVGEVDEAEAAAVDARWREGFDVVLGNPPYVRQELLRDYKEHWKARFSAYDGVADLYVYFFELGLGLLKPGGRLGFVVANKWLKAGYAAPLRGLLATTTEVEQLIDFGHAPIFPDADAFPSVLVLRRAEPHPTRTVWVTRFPREQLEQVELADYVDAHAREVPQARLGTAPWAVDEEQVERLMARLRERGVPLAEYAGCKPTRGVLTGFNEAFLVDSATRAQLVREDARSGELLRPFVRGANIDRWAVEWEGEYMLAIASSGDRRWPWTGREDAEAVFAATYPAVYTRFKAHERSLRVRRDQGRHWWELRACAYYEIFERPKILYQEIQFHPCYALDTTGLYINNTAWTWPTADPWALAVLNSPVCWWFSFRHLDHGKDEALRPFGEKMLTLPIAPPTPEGRALAEELVPTVLENVRENQRVRRSVLQILRTDFQVTRPGRVLEQFHHLDGDQFVQEVRDRRPRAAGFLRTHDYPRLRELHEAEFVSMLRREQAVAAAERELAAAVSAAYGLGPEDLATLRQTAPPRMPPGL